MLFLLVTSCQKSDPTPAAKPVGSGSGSGKIIVTPQGSAGARPGSGSAATMPPAAPAIDLDSKDILARTDTATEVTVRHVLIGWADLLPVYGARMDKRAQGRSNADAAKLAQEVLGKLKANPADIEKLAKETSEDPGSQQGDPYTIAADTPFVPEFKNLALRLKEKEAGIVKTKFGYHVIERVPPPPPDPLESADILARPQPANVGVIDVQHVMVGWKDLVAAGDPRAKARTKADADKLAKEILGKVRAGGDMAKLMKEFSEDPGTKDTARSYEITTDTQMPQPFKKLALRLKDGEAGLVKTEVGWHIIKRVPADSLNSTDILTRTKINDSVKVKHILLGWKGANTNKDKRGKERDRPALEKLVKETVAKLKKGDKIEPLMKELSEDEGSAAAGTDYPVTPSAGLVPPFKNLSLRLNKGEVGVVKTQFGIHIIQRTE
ncbi:MAG: peptidylprolyl isomerase [Kofleriaceae bacterium]